MAGRPSNNRHTAANFAARFWRKVRKAGPGECWAWTGSKLPNGRGQVHLRWEGKNNVRRFAYVVAWELTHGPVADGVRVCHRCDNPNCCNPSHLFLGTQAENIRDCALKGRRNAFGQQKLQIPQVREIRALAALGMRHTDLAANFGIARNTVSQIVARVSWAWLDAPEQTPKPVPPQAQQPNRPRQLPSGPFELVRTVELPVLGEVS